MSQVTTRSMCSVLTKLCHEYFRESREVTKPKSNRATELGFTPANVSRKGCHWEAVMADEPTDALETEGIKRCKRKKAGRRARHHKCTRSEIEMNGIGRERNEHACIIIATKRT